MFQVKEPKEQERKSICRYYLKIYENEPDDISQIKIEEHIYPRVPSIKRRGNKQTMQDTHEGRTYLVSSEEVVVTIAVYHKSLISRIRI